MSNDNSEETALILLLIFEIKGLSYLMVSVLFHYRIYIESHFLHLLFSNKS